MTDEIYRSRYLNKIVRKKKNGLIKIVSGIRRCGKSYLLNTLFANYLKKEGVQSDHIIKISLEDRRNKTLRDPDELYKFVTSKKKDKKDYFILLDEIQLVDEFEDVLNGFLHVPNFDVYVTGSNSKFLSSDIITEFRGRGDEVRMHPLSFSEFFSAYKGTQEEAWDDYVNYGGMPYAASLKTAEDKMEYLKDLFAKLYVSDIIERNNVRGEIEIEEILDVLSSAIGSLTSPLKLSRTFQSVKNKNISDHTIKNYISYFEDAFMISQAKRYDVKGKKYINTSTKYYFEDVGLRNARINFRQTEENHILENIIYNELLIRGFSVDVGVVEVFGKNKKGVTTKTKLEIDFIANKGNQKYYIQSALNLDSPEKAEQEMRPLLKIKDSFKKIIIIKENIKPRRTDDGIVIMGIVHFLLNDDSLDA